jgi:hypothetical protein
VADVSTVDVLPVDVSLVKVDAPVTPCRELSGDRLMVEFDQRTLDE